MTSLSLTPKKREFLQRFYKAEILPTLDQYWTEVYQLRVEQDSWPVDAPLVDLFKPFRPRPKRGEEENKVIGCIIPVEDARPFWECVLALYVIYKPEMWENEGRVARQFLDFLPKTLQPENLNQEVLKWLHEIAEGRQELSLWTYPVEVTIAIKILFLMASNYPKSPQQLKDFNDQVEKWKDQAMEEDGKRLKPWEDEYKEILEEDDV